MTLFLSFSPPVIAHRGASAHAPENTIAAFAKAAQLDIKWVEFDVMLSSDKVPIIFHDETLDRTTGEKGDIAPHSFAYLRTLDAGSWFHPRFSGEKIPSLEQTLEFLKNSSMSANVEIKPLPGQEEATVLQTLKEIKKYFPEPSSSILFSSFSWPALAILRKHAPIAMLGLLLHEWEPNWEEEANKLNCISIHVNEEIMTQSAAKKIKAMNKKLLCYTVNDPKRALELYSWGVDAVFSDVPDKIVQALKRM